MSLYEQVTAALERHGAHAALKSDIDTIFANVEEGAPGEAAGAVAAAPPAEGSEQ